MNYPDSHLTNIQHDPGLVEESNEHTIRFDPNMTSVSHQINQLVGEFQTNVLSQLALEFQTIHERLDAIEERVTTLGNISANRSVQTRLVNIENQLNEFSVTSPTLRDLLPKNQIVQSKEETPTTFLQASLNQTQANTNTQFQLSQLANTHLYSSSGPSDSNEQTQIGIHGQSSSLIPIISDGVRDVPVSQLPTEENAKVKVLLRHFASKAMSYIEDNPSLYTNVNNNFGAISTLKKIHLYDSPAWDEFVKLNFPYVSKTDLKSELIKILSVKVKNTKARFKKRTSMSTETNDLQQLRLQPHELPGEIQEA
ncbi:hypothetical protein K7432_002835 [Basidiobolus ranarum]|uniref:BEN domain-containing protein n=1 Tax=Basidiobolus ranarum TaxID=34480 RepID=A0ABR2W738_9FUNG